MEEFWVHTESDSMAQAAAKQRVHHAAARGLEQQVLPPEEATVLDGTMASLEAWKLPEAATNKAMPYYLLYTKMYAARLQLDDTVCNGCFTNAPVMN